MCFTGKYTYSKGNYTDLSNKTTGRKVCKRDKL